MLRKFKVGIISLASLFSLTIGGVLAYWGFGASDDGRTINAGADVDNIYENYNIGKPNPIPEYDMYIFPSTYYLSQANATTRPEDLYGYINMPLDAEGISSNKATFIQTNSKINNTLEATNQYCIDIDNYPDESVGHDTRPNWYDVPEFYATHKENAIEKNSYEGGVKLGVNKHFGPTIIGGTTKPDLPAGEGKSYNDIGSYKTDIEVDNKDLPDANTNFKEESKPYYQQLNIDDRLGYWYELEANQGRFLPIKISFTGSISPETFIKLVPNPRADLPDKNNWHNYKFANWVYYNLTGAKPYNLPNEGFSNYDRLNIFDILSNLEDYAVEENGRNVIRLFPTFTNGKDYNDNHLSTDIRNMSEDIRSQGYRDGLRVDYTTLYEGRKDYQTRYFSFESGEQNTSIEINGRNAHFNYAVINDFNVDNKELKYIDFNGVFTDTRNGNSTELYYSPWSNSDDAANWGVSYFNDKNVKTFGAGDKNLYAFGTADYYSTEQEALDAIDGLVKKMEITSDQNIVYNGIIGDTTGRSLVPIKNNDTEHPMYLVLRGSRNLFHAYAFFFERIIEFKNISNTPVNDTPSGEEDGLPIYQEKNPGDILKHYITNYESSPAFYLETEKYYEGKVENNVFIPSSSSSINEKNRFVYKADLLDSTNISTLFFGIRMAETDLQLTPHFNTTPLTNGNTHIYHTEDNLSAGQAVQLPTDLYGTYENASNYIEHVKFKYVNSENKEVTTNGFKLKEGVNLDPKGVYSVVMHYDPDSGSGYNFDVYVYKARDIFIKVFNDKLNEVTDKNNEAYGFLDHYDDNKYYERTYISGQKLMYNQDKFTKKGQSESKTLEQIFIEYCETRINAKLPYGQNNFYTDANGIYYLTDAISRSLIMRYEANPKDGNGPKITFAEDNELTVLKNQVLTVISRDAYKADTSNPLPELDEVPISI